MLFIWILLRPLMRCHIKGCLGSWRGMEFRKDVGVDEGVVVE